MESTSKVHGLNDDTANDKIPCPIKSSSENEDNNKELTSSSDSSDSSDSEHDNTEENSMNLDLTCSSDDSSDALVEKISKDDEIKNKTLSRESSSSRNPSVNTNRAAARFRQQQNAEIGLMALGTKKRDRRTIEEIQRDIQKKRGKSSTVSATEAILTKKNMREKNTLNQSPNLSSDSGVEIQNGMQSANAASKVNKVKQASSARSRLAMKVFGRGGRATPSVKSKKPSQNTTGIVTNISAGKMIKTATTASELESKGSRPEKSSIASDGKSDNSRIVRLILRSLLRYGDLCDVKLFSGNAEYFADEYRLANFISRSSLVSSCKVPEERLLRYALELSELAQKSIDMKQDSIKFMDVEFRASQYIDRLYDNLKLRVAVQRALRAANCTKPVSRGMNTNGAYVLIAKQSDVSVLNIGKDCAAWLWAEKEHEWSSRKDFALLMGVYVHGFGCWEEILSDDLLHFHQQRGLKGERLKKRAEALMKKLPPPDNIGDPILVYKAHALQVESTQQINVNKQSASQGNNAVSNTPAKNRERAIDRATVLPSTDTAMEPGKSARKEENTVTSADVKPSIATRDSEEGQVNDNLEPVEPMICQDAPQTYITDSCPSSPAAKIKNSSLAQTKPSVPLSFEQMTATYKPSEKLKEIRQVLKKLKIMSEWAKDQKDYIVVEKVLKYITTVGCTIDRLVIEYMDTEGEEHEADGYSTCLWTLAASYTPYTAPQMEQLYDDICADAASLAMC